MVSNYDRIYTEIKKEAQGLAPQHSIDQVALVDLAMKIVDLEDQHHIKSVPRINQRVEELIHATAIRQIESEEQ